MYTVSFKTIVTKPPSVLARALGGGKDETRMGWYWVCRRGDGAIFVLVVLVTTNMCLCFSSCTVSFLLQNRILSVKLLDTACNG